MIKDPELAPNTSLKHQYRSLSARCEQSLLLLYNMSTKKASEVGWQRFCAHCKKLASKEVVLSNCAGCKSARYCVRSCYHVSSSVLTFIIKSRECQKGAWRTHKDMCKHLQQMSDDDMVTSDRLLQFAKANMATIGVAGGRALELGRDPSRASRDIFVIYLCPNDASSRSETAFVVTDASVISVSDLGQESGRYLELLADKNNFAKSVGFVGAFLVWFILQDAGGKQRLSFPISFGNEIFQPDTSIIPWLVQLAIAINTGNTII